MNSRISDLREKIEAGEEVDLNQIALLQGLDAVIAHEEYTTAAFEREKEADDEYARLVGFTPN